MCGCCHYDAFAFVGPRIRRGAPPPPVTLGRAGSRAPRSIEAFTDFCFPLFVSSRFSFFLAFFFAEVRCFG